MAETRICYIGGAGRLGWPMAVWSAHRFPVIVADNNAEAVDAINAGQYHSPEPQVDSLTEFGSAYNLMATTDVAEAVRQSDIVIVLVQTPSKFDGSFSIEYVLAACQEIGAALAKDDSYKVISISSTVNPGETNGPILACLERCSGKRAHRDFGLCYCPEFVRQGNIIDDFSRPEYVVIGYSDRREFVAMNAYYRTITAALQICGVRIESAEIAKIGLNVAVTAKVARANELALLCHYTPGADATEVLHAIGLDSRIGPKYFKPGPPPGGPCFPRDNRSLTAAMLVAGLQAHIATATVGFELYHSAQLARIVVEETRPGQTVGLLGLAYKPGVNLMVGSQSEQLANDIYGIQPDCQIIACDPMVKASQFVDILPLEQVVRQSDVLVLMTCCAEFRQLEKMDLAGKTIVDMWGYLGESRLAGCRYVRFGKGKELDL